jgi:cytochrome oxidase Cu insertion factor (SCO1/SenC/PrrC family)
MENKAAVRSKKRSLFALTLVFGPALILIFMATRGCDHRFKTLADYGLVDTPTFTVYNHKGKQQQTLQDYQDQIVLISTLQTTCPYNCGLAFFPLTQNIYKDLRTNKRKKLKQVRMLSIVVDSLGNPVSEQALLDIQDMLRSRVEGYDPEIWQLVSADPKIFYNLTNNGQKLIVKDAKYFGGISYNELIMLLDKNNHLRMVLNGHTEGMIRKMKEHLALLIKQYDKERAQTQD